VEPGAGNIMTTDRIDADGIPAFHRTDIQVAQAAVIDGHLVRDRDAPVDLDLRRAHHGSD
jgi:hypothetical protein